MQKNHYVAKGLNENPIFEIIRVLKYKANWKGKKLIQIDTIQVVKYVMFVISKIKK